MQPEAEEVAKEERKYTIENVKRRDLIADELIDVLKITAPDPLSIGGTENSIREKVKAGKQIQNITKIIFTIRLIPGKFYFEWRRNQERRNRDFRKSTRRAGKSIVE